MDIATNQPSPKRVRIDTTDPREPIIAASAKSPTDAAKIAVSTAVASLQNAWKSVAEHHGLSFIRLKTKMAQQENTTTLLTDDAYLPKSARIQFQLNGSQKVTEQPEFKTLAAEAQTLITDFHIKIKAILHKAADLEKAETTKCANETFLNGCIDFATFILIERRNLEPTTTQKLVFTCECIQRDPTLLKHTSIAADGFHQTLVNHTAATPTTSIEYAATNTFTTAELTHLHSIIKSVLVTPFDHYQIKQTYVEREITLLKFAKLSLDLPATAATAEAMDIAPQFDVQTISDLIKSQVSAELKRIMPNKTRQHQTKNGQRGTASNSPENKINQNGKTNQHRRRSVTPTPKRNRNNTDDSKQRQRSKSPTTAIKNRNRQRNQTPQQGHRLRAPTNRSQVKTNPKPRQENTDADSKDSTSDSGRKQQTSGNNKSRPKSKRSSSAHTTRSRK